MSDRDTVRWPPCSRHSTLTCFREIRELLTGTAGVNALTRDPLKPLREIRADQYGIRTSLDVEGDPLKFEIIHEGRIPLDTPGSGDHVCGVTTLSALDTAASKLLANADRWADRSTFSRDLIDLAMLTPPSALLETARGLPLTLQADLAHRGHIDLTAVHLRTSQAVAAATPTSALGRV